MGPRLLTAGLLLTEVKSPVLGRPSTPPHHQYKPHTLSLRLYSHEAQAGTPSRGKRVASLIIIITSARRRERGG